MGMHPSATLYYGIYLGCPDEDEIPEWAESEDLYEELDRLLTGIHRVGYGTFGYCDYPRYVICTRTIHCYAYDDRTVDTAELQATPEETEALKQAWTALGMNGPAPEPRWFLTTSYG